MKALVCELCGSNEFVKEDGYFVCQHCHTKYSPEEAKKIMVEGTVDVSGSTVKVDSSEKLNRLFQLARRAREDSNYENAEKYYSLICEEDPDSWEAAFYSTYFKACQCKISEIKWTAFHLCKDTETVLALVKIKEEKHEQQQAVIEITNRVTEISSMLYSAAKQHFDSITQDQHSYASEFAERAENCYALSFNIGDKIGRFCSLGG